MKRRKWNLFFIVAIPLVCSCGTKQQQDTVQCIPEEGVRKTMRYLVPDDYMADPAVHVFNDRLYIYPSHDWESGIVVQYTSMTEIGRAS